MKWFVLEDVLTELECVRMCEGRLSIVYPLLFSITPDTYLLVIGIQFEARLMSGNKLPHSTRFQSRVPGTANVPESVEELSVITYIRDISLCKLS
ncbi:hypothetical protein NPIL_645981 [Nephila pilipes]|uniref:Uncharacterized protein n=1 Tax=Nephila pilipes TaxID=299642 RepID=A0A8X6QW54_NEPPI|nr:hypothetical protein NPIL_645981 [Nephila pilipes]